MTAAIGLTGKQSEAIERVYQQQLVGRRRCIERLVEASNQVDQRIQDGAYDDDMLRGTQAVIKAAADERALTAAVNDEIAGLLSPEQRQRLARLRPGRVVE